LYDTLLLDVDSTGAGFVSVAQAIRQNKTRNKKIEVKIRLMVTPWIMAF